MVPRISFNLPGAPLGTLAKYSPKPFGVLLPLALELLSADFALFIRAMLQVLTFTYIPAEARNHCTLCVSQTSRAGFALALHLDQFLPQFDCNARYELPISAPPSTVYRALLNSDFSQLWLVKLFLTLRTGRRLAPGRKPADLRKRLERTGYVILLEVPDHELVLGLAGRFALMVADASGSRRMIFPLSWKRALPRPPGISISGRTRPAALFWLPKRASNVSALLPPGSFASTGSSSAPSPASSAKPS